MKRLLVVLALVLTAACSPSVSTPSPAPTCDPGPPGTREVTVGDRSFLLHIPQDVVNPSPVVFSFHGRGSNARQQLLLTDMAQVAEANRFILVLPNAVGGRWRFGGADDGYIDQVIAAVPCADPSRRYASGMSMGSAMTFAEACRKDRRFAAFGGVAVALYVPRCADSPPAPIIYFHGTRDEVVPFRGGQPVGESLSLPAVPATMRRWAQHDGCSATSRVRLGRDVVLRQWSECAGDVAVDYYRVNGGGHTWPGAPKLIADAVEPSLGRTTQTVAASELMWEFFSRYTLPA